MLLSTALFLRNGIAETEQAEKQVSDRARLLSEDVDREVSRVVASAEVLATSESLMNGDFAGFYRRAVQVRDLLGTNVVVRDLSSQQLLNTRAPWGTALPRNTLFDVDRRVIETRQVQVSGLLTGAVTKASLLIVVVPVFRSGDIVYLLSLTISLERLQNILSPDRMPPGWIAGVVDRSGVVIARSRNAEQFVGTRVDEGRWTAIKDTPEGVHHLADLEGLASVQAYSRSAISGWLVGVSVPTSLLAAPSHRSLQLFAGGGLVLVLCGVAVAILLGRRLTGPIMQLSGAAQALGAGQSVSVRPAGVVEMDAVAGALRDAADLIRTRTAALAESEARLRRVVDGAPFPIIVHADDGEIVHISRSLADMTGYARQEVATIDQWLERAVEGGRDVSAFDIDRLYTLDRPIDEGEFAILTADGQRRVWSFRSAPIGRGRVRQGGGNWEVVRSVVDQAAFVDGRAVMAGSLAGVIPPMVSSVR